MLYTVYKTVNLINGKEYVGFHKIKEISDIIYEESENGSIFNDGYLGSGKLMRRALEKYGPMNMKQKLILVTNDEKEAKMLERDIVCEKWVDDENTYNLVLGGGITILLGEKNGFYNKKHSKETIEKIQKSRNKTLELNPWTWSMSTVVGTENILYNYQDILEYFDISNTEKVIDEKFEVSKLVYEGKIMFHSEYIQQSQLKRYKRRKHFIDSSSERYKSKSEMTSKRFKGVKKSEESNLKRGKSISKWIKENPDEHNQRMDKINKNPEKIRKTAEKHRGMKRSEVTCKRISEALLGLEPKNKGKIWIHNIETKERLYVEKDIVVPSGWSLGMGKRK